MDWMTEELWGGSLQVQGVFCSPEPPEQLSVLPSQLFSGYQMHLSLELKQLRHAADNSLLSSAEVKNGHGALYTSTSPYTFVM
jgi:hypothetical protein